MNFFDWKKFSRGQWLAFGAAVTILFLFVWSESERRRPSEELTRGLEEARKSDDRLRCKFLREAQNWVEYDKQKCSSL